MKSLTYLHFALRLPLADRRPVERSLVAGALEKVRKVCRHHSLLRYLAGSYAECDRKVATPTIRFYSPGYVR